MNRILLLLALTSACLAGCGTMGSNYWAGKWEAAWDTAGGKSPLSGKHGGLAIDIDTSGRISGTISIDGNDLEVSGTMVGASTSTTSDDYFQVSVELEIGTVTVRGSIGRQGPFPGEIIFSAPEADAYGLLEMHRAN